ncbi:MAG: WD40 repeat domain-containing protein, partial [Phycisphaerales bacterium]
MKHSFLQSTAWLVAMFFVLVVPSVTSAQCDGRWMTGPDHVPPGLSNAANALAVMPNGDLIAGGEFATAGGVTVNFIARWNGSSWLPLGTGMSNAVRALAVMPNGDIIAGGGFLNAGGRQVNYIARWDGTSWSALGSGMWGTNFPVVHALCVLPSGELIAGGDFITAGGVTVNRIARWNGSAWAPLGGGTSGSVRALAFTPNGDIIAGGNFLTAGGVVASHIARWDGASWSSLGGGMDSGAATSFVYALAVMPNGDLVAGGTFSAAGGQVVRSIARWNGTVWAPLGPGAGGLVRTLCPLPNGDIIAGGWLGINWVRRWNGSSWTTIGSSFADPNQSHSYGVNSLVVLQSGDVIAGGNFGSVDGLWTNFIARWGGSSWTSLGAGLGGERTA